MTDVVTFGSDKPPWRPSRRLVVAVVVVVVAVVAAAAFLLVGRDHPGSVAGRPSASVRVCRSAAVSPSPPVAGPPAALAIGCAAGDGLVRHDPAADRGPWTVVVRRVDGSLGRHGAVVTFPVAAPPSGGRRVAVGGAAGVVAGNVLTWPVGGAYARVRGDLPEADLVAIGACTSVVADEPAVNPPAGFIVAGAGPYRPVTIAEVRYGSAGLGEAEALGGGLTFTGVARGGGFEDQLYAVGADDGGLVDGHPAVVSKVFGGNGGLGWEPAPGVVAYVGYSGAVLNGDAVAALRRLAARTRPLSAAEWKAINPTVSDQTNEPG